jgi:LysR family transcriptional activator of nhaA
LEALNYHHLRYFWVVAREGGLVPAGKVLRLSHPTLSAQIHALERQLGQKLFVKPGRKLVLTEVGRVVYQYADEIFNLGRELTEAVAGRATGRALRLNVGIADVVPKLVVRRLLQPALSLPVPIRLACYESSFDKLLGDLAAHTLDVVLSDAPVPPGSNVRAFDHLLGETGVSFFGTKELVRAHRRGFPRSLDGAPMLMPLESLTLRRSLDEWLAQHRITPRVVAEFEDSALLKVFGGDGLGIFAAPSVVEAEVAADYGVEVLGRAPEVRERYYAISVERRLENPAVVAISGAARDDLFRAGRRKPAGARRTQKR